MEIKRYEDLVMPTVTVHAFYMRHLLPIHLDVQVPGATRRREGAVGPLGLGRGLILPAGVAGLISDRTGKNGH